MVNGGSKDNGGVGVVGSGVVESSCVVVDGGGLFVGGGSGGGVSTTSLSFRSKISST
jgi:hypothetical protein